MNKAVLPIILLSLLATNSVLAKNSLTLTSSVIEEGGKLPLKYTCDGDGVSPPLNWSGITENVKSLVLIMDHLPHAKTKQEPQSESDQEQKKPSSNDLRYYWSMYNVPINTTEIKEGKTIGILGSNIVNNKNEYASPCSKGPGVKSYAIHIYALSNTLDLSTTKNVTATVLRQKMEGLIIDSDTLNFSFQRAEGSNESSISNDSKREERKNPPKKPDVQLNVPTLSESVSSKACSNIQASVAKAGYKNVRVTCDKTYAYVQSDTYPDHDLMNGITGTNEQIPVPALNYTAPILLNPEMADTKTSIDAALGVAINGVPIYDYSAQGEIDLHGYDATKDTLLLGQLDKCGGHSGRGDDYHYHAKPTCMIELMENFSDSTIIGWGYDGFPLYGDANPDGSTITKGDLDVCNGQVDTQFGYRYHTSVEAPYIIQCLVGKVDLSILPRVAPLSGAKARADLKPPREGVENLKHTQTNDGTRMLKYSYKGDEYYTRFKPSSTKENCYDFEQKTISNNGAIESGTYCR